MTKMHSRQDLSYLANVSHELKTPLAAIIGYADMLKESSRSPEKLESIERIQSNAHDMLNIIRNLLDLTSLGSDYQKADKRKFSLPELIHQVAELSLQKVKARKVKLDFDIRGELPPVMHGDPSQLKQLLLHLADNAVDFAEWGRIRFTIYYEKEKDQLHISVAEGGSRQALKEPDKVSGHALRLALCRELVKLMGGKFRTDNTEGSGAEIRISVPVNSHDQDVPIFFPEEASIAKRPTGKGPAFKGRILVVDDREDFRKLLEYYIERAGGEVLHAASGEEALQVWEHSGRNQDSIHAICMDMKMPGQNGFAATRRLRDAGFDGPIIAITAKDGIDEREHAFRAGCDAFLPKPFAPELLISSLTDLLGPEACLWTNPEETRSRAIAPHHLEFFQSGAKQILVVEGDSYSGRLLHLTISRSGHTVFLAKSGMTAIEQAKDIIPDVGVVDLDLPDTDGMQLFEQLKGMQGNEQCQWILLYDPKDAQRRKKAEELGCRHFLQKPPDLGKLLQYIALEKESPSEPTACPA